jgi:hypothetical protein
MKFRSTRLNTAEAQPESRHHKRIGLFEKSAADRKYKIHKELAFSSLEEAEAKAAELDQQKAQPELKPQPEAKPESVAAQGAEPKPEQS